VSNPEFIIVTAATPDYARQAAVFMPSWIRHSGAKEIIVRTLPDPEKTSRWECQVERNVVVRDVVLDAKRRGLRVAMLDIDCWTLGSLHDAFDGIHPLGVARWPLINCGVQFYDTLLEYDFEGFLNKVVNRVRAALDAYKKGNRIGLVEQKAWEREFHAVGDDVNKLNEDVWNLCVADNRWQQKLNEMKDKVRIVHVKGRGEHKHQDWRIRTAYEVFGDRIKPDV